MVDESRLCEGCWRTYTVTGGDFDPNWTIHPGVHWREMIEHEGVPNVLVARDIGCTPKHLSQILVGHAMPSAALTVRFAEWVGVEPRFLWQLRCNYELDIALGKKDVTT